MTDQAEREVDTEVVDAFNQFYTQYYDERIRELPEFYADDDTPSLTIDYRDLESFDKELAKALNNNPDTFYYSGVRALQEYLDDEEVLNESDLRLSHHNDIADNIINIRNIRSKHINQMVSVEGIVKTSSMVLPRVTKARFICRSCGTAQYENQPTSPASLQYPYQCQNADCSVSSKNAFQLDKRESERVDFQKIVVEEAPEDLRGGENPQSVNCYISGDITGEVTPGDRIGITGILRADNQNDNPVLTHFLEANQIQKKEKEFEEIEIGEEDKKTIEELSEREDLYSVVMNSVAPSIYGYDDQKMAVAMQLFSGVTKDAPDTHIRGDIHCLMVGDPGTGKSEIIQSAKELAPRGVYTVGKGSSSAGLTAAAVKDSDMAGDQKWTLEAGALVLADKGIACVDEIDKMRSEDRSALHEALEQQSYHRDTEVLLANGERQKMGDLVDELMSDDENEVTDAVNCEILDMDDGELRLHTVDLESGGHEKIDVDRVSRHEAPDQMVEITFSNGRSITVTPEHPLYTTENGEVSTVDAIDATEGTFAPAPRQLPNSTASVPLQTNTHGRLDNITLPDELTGDVSELLGHLAAEGNAYEGDGGYVIGYTNSDEQNRARVKQLFTQVFGDVNFDYNQSGESAPTIRINSKKIYTWFKDNHPEILNSAGKKRVPSTVLGSSEENIRRFLVGAFTGDGSVESTAISITTKSHGLAEDYADAMLKIGVASRIVEYETDDGVYYKTVVKGDSNKAFTEKVITPSEKSVEAAESLSFDDSDTHHDVLPTDFINEIRSLRKDVGLTNDGSLYGNIENGYGIQISTAEKHLSEIESRISKIESRLAQVDTIENLRNILGWSQRKLAEEVGETTSTINYIENEGGYGDGTDAKVRTRSIQAATDVLESTEDSITRIRELSELRYERITGVEVVDNTGEDRTDWVYDLTVEPTRTFVGQGVVLHNTVSVNKAGINATLKSRCSLLAAANPTYGRFDEYEAIAEQIELEPALISRFDLIFTIQDKPDPELDANIAEHLLDINEAAMHEMQGDVIPTEEGERDDVFDDALDPELLRKYIAYARQNCNPIVTGDQKEKIKEFYTDLRDQGDDDSPIAVTARAVQSMIRLSEAVARMRLGDEVTEEDIKKAISIKEASLQDVGVDPVTGELDADAIESGTTKTERDQKRSFETILKELTEEYPSEGAPFGEIAERAKEESGMSEDEVEDELNNLQRRGEAMNPSGSRWSYIDRS